MRLDLKAPHTVYKRSDGKRLSGVTTILGVLAKPSLLGWYASMERDGIRAALQAGGVLSEMFPVGKDGKPRWFAEAKRDKAADLGTVTHARCEAWLTGQELEPDGIPAEMYEQSLRGFARFKEWWDASGLQLLHSERVLVYDDGRMAYGGTADLLAKDGGGSVHLLDLKTSKASKWWPYKEVFGQVAAYAEAAENDPKTALHVDHIKVLRIGKEAGDELQVHGVTPAQRAAGWRLFRAAYEAHEAEKELSR